MCGFVGENQTLCLSGVSFVEFRDNRCFLCGDLCIPALYVQYSSVVQKEMTSTSGEHDTVMFKNTKDLPSDQVYSDGCFLFLLLPLSS